MIPAQPLTLPDTPYNLLGGRARVTEIAERFYDAMDAHEPALAKLHPLDPDGKVARPARDRFALFFIGWLGGPQDYVAQHGHPRLRMRHARVPVDPAMRDAWMRAMGAALDQCDVTGDLRAFLNQRLYEVADMMRNTP